MSESDNKRFCSRNTIEEFLGGGYAEPIDLSTIDNSIVNNDNSINNNDEPFQKRSRQTADQIIDEKDGILYDILNITHPFFNLRDEFNTISIFFSSNNDKHPEFKQLLVQYVSNAVTTQDIKKAIELKTIIMQFIADKLNN